MCVIIVRVGSVQEVYTKQMNLSSRLYECNSMDFISCYVVWRTTYWWTLCIFSDFIFLLILLFYIHRYILYECYNWKCSIRTGVVYNSDLHFLVFVSHCVMDNILMNFMYIFRSFKIIFFYVLLVNDTDYMCIIIGRICSIWTGGVDRVIGQTIYRWTLYVFLYGFRSFIYAWYILHEYYNSTNSIWTGGRYKYDSFMIILYGQIMILQFGLDILSLRLV